MKRLMLICYLIGMIGPTAAVEQALFKRHGDYKIFYSAFGSSFLTPEIAAANDIVRGKGKGLVNIAVVKTLGIGTSAQVSGEVFNIFQQRQKLKFTQIQEQNTLYYLAPFEFDNEDYLTFKITVLPSAEEAAELGAYAFKFQKKMYHD